PCPPPMDPTLTLPQKRKVIRPFHLTNNNLKALAQQSKFNMRTRLTPKVKEVGSTLSNIHLRCEKYLATFLSNCLEKGIPWPAPLPILDPHSQDAPTPLLSALCRGLSDPDELAQPPGPLSSSAKVS
ncbi:hypothetical protein L0F63_003433, partial [Massospora cicadina]